MAIIYSAERNFTMQTVPPDFICILYFIEHPPQKLIIFSSVSNIYSIIKVADSGCNNGLLHWVKQISGQLCNVCTYHIWAARLWNIQNETESAVSY